PSAALRSLRYAPRRVGRHSRQVSPTRCARRILRSLALPADLCPAVRCAALERGAPPLPALQLSTSVAAAEKCSAGCDRPCCATVSVRSATARARLAPRAHGERIAEHPRGRRASRAGTGAKSNIEPSSDPVGVALESTLMHPRRRPRDDERDHPDAL